MAESRTEAHITTSIEQVSCCLLNGGVAAVPTETYYGLAADCFNERAVEKVFQIKKRDYSKPLLLLISDEAQLFRLVAEVPELYRPLMERYWPGPLTLIFPAKPYLPPLVTGGTGTIGVRISSNHIVQKLLQSIDTPITATSANVSGLQPPVTPAQVQVMFDGKLDYILDGGETPGGLASTIIGCSGKSLKIVRQGVLDIKVR